jgi:hypothetical protein
MIDVPGSAWLGVLMLTLLSLIACHGTPNEDTATPPGEADADADADADTDCDTDADADTEPTTNGGFRLPTLEIVSPTGDVDGPDFEVDVAVTDFMLVPPTNGTGGPTGSALWPPRAPAVGPLLSWLEPTAEAHQPCQAPQGSVVFRLDGIIICDEPELACEFTGIAPGLHTLETELLWADGVAFFPNIVADRQIQVN